MTARAQVEPSVEIGQEPQPLELAEREVDGFYNAAQRGKVTHDGSLLDCRAGLHATASAWRLRGCPLLQCYRSEVGHLIPDAERMCNEHGKLKLPAVNPYPLEGAERQAADGRAWSKLAEQSRVLARDQWASFATASAQS